MRKILISIASLFFCAGLLALFTEKSYAEEIVTEKEIAIEMKSIPAGIKPGDKPITLNTSLLGRLLPELRNPRLMSFKDIVDSYEQNAFIEGGYSFVLRGDFDRDGFADIAFVGKHENPNDNGENCFIAIFSIKGKKVVREYLAKLSSPRVFLLRIPAYKPGIDAMQLVYKFGTEECGYLYWIEKKYQYDLCKSVY